jgi:hypothetical protein
MQKIQKRQIPALITDLGVGTVKEVLCMKTMIRSMGPTACILMVANYEFFLFRQM